MAKPVPVSAQPALSQESSDSDRALLLSVVLLGSMCLVVRPAAAQFSPYSTDAAFAALVAILFAFCAGLRAVLAKPAAAIPPALSITVVLWTGLFLWGVLRSPNLGAAVPQGCDAVLYILMLLSGFFIARREPALIAIFSRAMIAMVVVEACAAIWQRYVDLPYLQAQVRSGKELLPAALQTASGLSRLYGDDVFGSFGNPNSLAAFLIIGIWLTAGHFAAASGAGMKRLLPAMFFVTIMIFALLLTNSKGGNVACLAGGWFFLLQRLHTRPRLQRVLKALTVAGIAGGLAILALGYFNKVPLPFSMYVRVEYWKAAFGMIAEHPLDGVGLAGFAENYTFFKSPLGTETKDAHNDYLHLWAELGILGPLTYLAAWFMLLCGANPDVEKTPDASADSPEKTRRIERLVIAGGVAAFLFSYLGFQPFNSAEIFRLAFGEPSGRTVLNSLFALALPALFACVIIALRPRGVEESARLDGAWVHGFKAAAGALLIHQLVDFDFKAQAVIGGMFLLGGMLYGRRHANNSEPASAPNLLCACVKSVPLAAAMLLLPFAVWIPMNSGGHRANAEALEQEAQALLRETPAGGGVEAAEKKHRAIRHDIADARLSAARAAPYDGNAWLELASALQVFQRAYPNIPREKEILAALQEAERLRPLAAYPKIARGDFYFYQAVERQKQRLSADIGFQSALESYSAGAARYPLAPGCSLLKGDALLMLGKTADAASAYLHAFETDIRIFDGNVRLSSIFTDPRPGALPRHGFEREVSMDVQNRLRKLPPGPESDPVRRGLLLRRSFSIASLLRENQRTGAMKSFAVENLQSELSATLNVFLRLTTGVQQRAHAALLLALSYELSGPSLASYRAAAWTQARALQQESVSAGSPGTPPALFHFLQQREKQ